MPEAEIVNVARHLPAMAARQPATPALRVPVGRAGGGAIRYEELTFAELEHETNAWAWKLTQAGVQPGDRVLVLVRPGLPLIAAVFALFKLGAPPVVIDPGMGRRTFLECVARTQPRFLLGIGRAQVLSWFFRDAFSSVRRRIWVRGNPAHRLARGAVPPIPPAVTGARDLAAILFTSGSTGTPKGVCYEHGMFEAQVRLIRATYGIAPGEVDLPMLPVFALFNPALGMTTVVPEIDPSRPATVDPAKIVQAIRQNGVTNTFGSPVIWTKVARHCAPRGIVLPGVKRILMAGAPVPPRLFAELRAIFPGAALCSPYGATEALPVSSVSAQDVLGDVTAGTTGEHPTSNIEHPTSKFGTAFAGGSEDVPRSRERQRVEDASRGGPARALSFAPVGIPLVLSDSAGTAALTAQGRGTCVGRAVAEMTVKVIAISDEPIASLAGARELPAGEIGEIIVAGPVVTEAYDLQPEATARAKIFEAPTAAARAPAENPRGTPDGAAAPAFDAVLAGATGSGDESTFQLPGEAGERVWHRMGDAGYLDAAGRLWFCGRLAERVETPHGVMFTDCVEPIFNRHPRVSRTALIGFGPRGKQVAALAVETAPAQAPRDGADRREFARELRELGLQHPNTALIRHFYFVPRFPVDVRHNAKIHRLRLARDLAGEAAIEVDRR